MEWIIGLILGGLFIATVLMASETNKCPNCEEDTVDVGYGGWKRKCMHCGWRNHD